MCPPHRLLSVEHNIKTIYSRVSAYPIISINVLCECVINIICIDSWCIIVIRFYTLGFIVKFDITFLTFFLIIINTFVIFNSGLKNRYIFSTSTCSFLKININEFWFRVYRIWNHGNVFLVLTIVNTDIFMNIQKIHLNQISWFISASPTLNSPISSLPTVKPVLFI